MSAERGEWQHNHYGIETALPAHARLGRSRKGTGRKAPEIPSKLEMTKESLARRDRDGR